MKSHNKTKLEIYAETIRLRAAEKRDLRERVVSYMEYHPLPSSAAQKKAATLASDSFVYMKWNSMYFRPMIGAFVLIFMVGIPLAAERAQPGDVLYSMKLRVNEEVQARLALSPYEKIAWDVTRVERRVAEARQLAKDGKLTSEKEAQLVSAVKEHTDSAAQNIATLRTTDVDSAAVAQVTLESALDVQAAILENTGSTSNTHATGTSVADITAAVKTAKTDSGNTADAASDIPLSYDRMSARVESETTRAHELAASVVTVVSPEEKGEIDRRFDDIDRAANGAKALKSVNQEVEAIDSLKKTLSDVQKLIAFMTDIDVRKSVTLEVLVPKILTTDERVTAINQAVDMLKRAQNEFVHMPQAANGSVARKVAAGIGQLEKIMQSIENERAADNIDAAEASVKDARALSDDIRKLTLSVVGSTTPAVIPTVASTTTASSTPTAH